mmetsp:Transcript_72491/g.224040  ORF Transcript_72491/g.224040 Transcript_72491/m.224040 type:complete len:435 (-) Transcript_72491:213-1517(-)
MVLVVKVVFHLDGERWDHDFEIDRGATVWQLKESMVAPQGGTREDVDAFEMQYLGRRVADTEKIYQPFTFDFEYLGPEEGKRRARNELADVEAWERKQKEEEAAKLRRPKPVVQEAAPAEKKGQEAATPFDSKPVVKAVPPLPAGDHEISITIDRGMELTTAVTVQGGAVILTVKEALSAQDPTGSMNVSSFGLGIAGNEEGPKALPDDTVLTEKHLNLEIAEPYVESAEEAANKPFPYTPADRSNVPPTPPLLPRWEVVGGGDKGGILVREGQDTKSPQLPTRLATGAWVNELRIDGERLQFQKLWGEGPETGWVSITLSGRDLVVKREPSFEELFTLEKALDLQEELMLGFSQPEFQRGLDEIFAEFPEAKGFKFQKRRNELFLTVQGQVLPKYGFKGDATGVMHMMRAFAPHQAPEVGWNNDQLNKLLRMG